MKISSLFLHGAIILARYEEAITNFFVRILFSSPISEDEDKPIRENIVNNENFSFCTRLKIAF